ncbi:MAG: hypothetical protein CBD99_003625 [Candidatus Pelagibacter sp. TMED239]|nr:MAG: hypothetical protein CBD99_003625 [Candidatus Pelagibacter sp. TMED239]
MAEEIDFETYLSLTKRKFEIYLFDKKNLKNLYKEEMKLENNFNSLDSEILSKFLDNHIFKIEKIIGKFIKNIYLILEDDVNFQVSICIKKKNYSNLINKKNLENTLIEVKDLFKESYQHQTITHMIISNYLINGKNYSSFIDNLRGDNLCLEINFMSISNSTIFVFDKTLEKYQIRISQYLNGNYIKSFFNDQNIELSEMANKLRNGYNHNEVILVPKNIVNKGFFEKFFQLFS